MLGLKLAQAPATAWWPPGAIYAADFINRRYMRAGAWVSAATAFSFTRASTGWANDSAGQWSEFAINAPRLTDRGLLIEPSRQNAIRNNAMAGAVAGTPGTLPTNWNRFKSGTMNDLAVVATGSEQGLDYIDVRIWGTATGTNDVGLNMDSAIAVAAGDTYAASAFVKVVSGSLSGITFAQFACGRYNSGTYVSNSPTVNVRSANGWAQLSFGDTVPGSGINQIRPAVSFRVPDAMMVDAIVRIARPQVELGASTDTSPITTTGSAVMRSEDAVALNLPVGTQTLTITFEDQSQQVISGLAGGTYLVPAGLNKPRIWRLFSHA